MKPRVAKGEQLIRWNMLLTNEEISFLRSQSKRENRTASDLVRSAIERLYFPNEQILPLQALSRLQGDYFNRQQCHQMLNDKL
ncbi:MAG: hypothetical protein H3C43_05595 [Leptonema sp. (in: Bacteria)]|nr:hypothetical protein [Leptonema sp. (in: bacteria)]